MDLKDNEILTVPCRLAFASLFKATPKHPTTPTEVRYQATVLIPKGSDMSPYANAIKAAMVEKFGKPIKLEGRCMPLKESGGQTTQDGRPYVGFEKGGVVAAGGRPSYRRRRASRLLGLLVPLLRARLRVGQRIG